MTLPAVPAGATCIVTQTADGHTADAVLASTTTVPAGLAVIALDHVRRRSRASR
ncbi:MAG: hypothetical protein VXY40_05930 [Actinomycetota bacterium]|nr:hypothetical protein [Actinomycetota bacterium]